MAELSLAALAKKYEVSYRVVCETAEREHWKEERELHASRFSTNALALAENDQAAKLVEVDSGYFAAGRTDPRCGLHCPAGPPKAARTATAPGGCEGSLCMAHLCLDAAT